MPTMPASAISWNAPERMTASAEPASTTQSRPAEFENALQVREPRGAQDEFVLAAIAQNLRQLASLFARPPPAHVPCVV
jgi:hypothetical protein